MDGMDDRDTEARFRKGPPKRRRWPYLALLLLCAGCPLILFALLPPLDPAPYIASAPSGKLLDRSGKLLYAYLNGEDSWSLPRALNEMSPHLLNATIAVEDQRFYLHPGVDPVAILRAGLQNLTGRRTVSGASTLTMQTVKLGIPMRRSVAEKLRQMVLALRLERGLSKEGILQAYLNRASYGANLIGVEAASRRYFGRTASELSPAQAALLAALPKAPSALDPLRHPGRALARRNFVLSRMYAEGYLSEAAHAEAKAEPLGAAHHDFPSLSPHLAMKVQARVQKEGEVHVTLDARLQEAAEQRIRAYLKHFNGEVTNAAAIVVDAASAEIRVRVGSAGFFAVPDGQVDLCAAPRSPGSALKPFTYGLAMDANKLYPSEILLDDTLDLGTYSPGNFDGDFNGLISVTDALRYSLNVPAVLALSRIGPERLYATLQTAGVRSLVQPPEYYGLGLTLGNCEVTLENLAAAYCALANLGAFRQVGAFKEASAPEVIPLLSPGAASALFSMLEAPFPGERERAPVKRKGTRTRAAWKTGTSTGQHDAWAVVFNRQYVVAVWVGNSNGQPSQRLVGYRAALPLAAALFRELEPTPAPDWPAPGQYTRDVSVCALSGLPISPFCPAEKTAQFPAEQWLARRCDVHYPGARPAETLCRWPGAAGAWDLARISAPKKPADLESTRAVALQILDPADRAEYLLTGEAQGDRVLLAASLTRMERLDWYLDDHYLGASAPDAPLFLDLHEGVHKLACLSQAGDTTAVRFSVLSADQGKPFRAY